MALSTFQVEDGGHDAIANCKLDVHSGAYYSIDGHSNS